ncbi:hypothetical protein GCM10007860_32970 [Chitiniphilus shinanonensis]|uniref:Uncharacterized protein n=1 Tax=Chitiniphilus shinanonensis TaxID=553088 RepID=A0ABQ6BVY0_9NEIS|nr:hypothetical protein GCM10007860_32970 [Chitiniphilus shinanonensis]
MGGEAGERGIEQAGAHVLIGGAGRPATGAGRWGGGHPLKLINDLINFKAEHRHSAVAWGESGGKGRRQGGEAYIGGVRASIRPTRPPTRSRPGR